MIKKRKPEPRRKARGKAKLLSREAVKPPTDPWDAQGWWSYLRDWKDDWPSPGGLDYDAFLHRFILAVVPDGWIKPGYGPMAQGRQRQDIGKGHAAFLNMSPLFNSLPGLLLTGNGQEIEIQIPRGSSRRKAGEIRLLRVLSDYFFRESIKAIVSDDAKFFPDFWQAVTYWRKCVKTGEPLLKAKKRRVEFMILTTALEDGEACYAVKQLRKVVLKRFPDESPKPAWKDIDKVVTRLGIKKCRSS
jgi:hypothetical protein